MRRQSNVYPSEHYSFWRAELPGIDLPWGCSAKTLRRRGVRRKPYDVGMLRLMAGGGSVSSTAPTTRLDGEPLGEIHVSPRWWLLCRPARGRGPAGITPAGPRPPNQTLSPPVSLRDELPAFSRRCSFQLLLK